MPQATKAEIARFTTEIEILVVEKGYTYMDGIVEYCRINDLDIDSIVNLIGPILKTKITKEAKSLNLVRRRKRKKK